MPTPSDLTSLSHMLSALDLVTSPGGCAFLQQMWPAAILGCVPDGAVPTAEVLLCDAWINCIGTHARLLGLSQTPCSLSSKLCMEQSTQPLLC